MARPDVDQLLRDLVTGDRRTFDRLLVAIYPDLLSIARGLLRGQRSDHPFEDTDLVHEAYLVLVQYLNVQWHGRRHFFGALTQTMRRLLIDQARAAAALKRTGEHVAFRDVEACQGDTALEQHSDWADVLDRLTREHPRWARIVECRCVQCLTIQETATRLGVSHCTVSADWRKARAWLQRELNPISLNRSDRPAHPAAPPPRTRRSTVPA
jgi:RNA polymerase sigma factor (TIGR02999 family)